MTSVETRILVFGTFDGIHPGHEFFLQQAALYGTRLLVGVARDAHVLALKNHPPRIPEQQRLEHIRCLSYVDEAFLCDEQLNTFESVRDQHPNMILLGHDQSALEEALIQWMTQVQSVIPIERLKKSDAA